MRIPQLPNSRPAGPQDFSAFEAPATLLGIINTDTIEGIFRGIHWKLRKLGNYKWNTHFVMLDGSLESGGDFALAQAFQCVYVTGMRLGRDA